MAIKKNTASTSKAVSQDSNLMAILTHILGIFFWFIPALIVYLAAEDKFTKDNAKSALNWQISAIVYGVISTVLIIILIGILFLGLLWLANIIFSIVAAIKASDGKVLEYPAAIKFIK